MPNLWITAIAIAKNVKQQQQHNQYFSEIIMLLLQKEVK